MNSVLSCQHPCCLNGSPVCVGTASPELCLLSLCRVKQGGCPDGWHHSTVGAGQILRPTGAAERNLGSVTPHTVRWGYLFLVQPAILTCFNVTQKHYPTLSVSLRLGHKDFVPGWGHPGAGAPAAVLRLRGPVLQLHRSVQHFCGATAPCQAAQHGGTFPAQVSPHSSVFPCAEGNCQLQRLTVEQRGKICIVFALKKSFPAISELNSSVQMFTNPLGQW